MRYSNVSLSIVSPQASTICFSCENARSMEALDGCTSTTSRIACPSRLQLLGNKKSLLPSPAVAHSFDRIFPPRLDDVHTVFARDAVVHVLPRPYHRLLWPEQNCSQSEPTNTELTWVFIFALCYPKFICFMGTLKQVLVLSKNFHRAHS